MKRNKTKQAAVLMAVLAATSASRVSADPAQTDTRADRSFTGKVTSVNPREQALNVRSWLFPKSFNLGNNCSYTLLAKTNGAAADLLPGEMVTVYYRNSGGVRIADRVEERPMQLEGAITSVDATNHTLTVRHLGTDKTFQIAEDCNVRLRNVKTPAASDLQSGYYVTVVYDTPNNTATARIIAQTSLVFTGRLTAIDLHKKTVQAKDMLATKKFNLAENCIIVAPGNRNGQLSDLKPNDRLSFSYDDIHGINVVSRIEPAPTDAQTNSMFTTYPAGY